MIYFTADTHFCHGNIIGHCYRPFSNVHEMNTVMIRNWNSLVTDRDDIYILGDFMYKGRGKEANDILSRLKGRKYLVKGNHEKYLGDPLFNQKAFEWIIDYFVLEYEKGLELILFHFPIFSWHKSHRGSIHLYGHVHNEADKNSDFAEKLRILGPRAVNVGVDVNDFYPVSIKQIFERIKTSIDECIFFKEE